MNENQLIDFLQHRKKDYEVADQSTFDQWISQLEDVLLTKQLSENPAVKKLLNTMRERIANINQQLTLKVELDTFTRVCLMTERGWLDQFVNLFDQSIKERLEKEITKL